MKWSGKGNALQFRPGHQTDLQSIYRLKAEPLDEQSWSLDYLHRILADSSQEFRLALHDQDLAGYIWLDWRQGSRGTVVVDSLVVAHNYRRRKIAERLLHWAIDRVSQAGWQRILLRVRADNTPALKLCGKFGFHKIEDLPGLYQGMDGILLGLEHILHKIPELTRRRNQLEGWHNQA